MASDLRILRVTGPDRDRFRDGLAVLDRAVTHPLGGDRFRVDHGADGFAFFDRLGETVCYVALLDGEVAAAGIGVLRAVPHRRGRVPAWYLCGLKCHPWARGRRLGWRVLHHALAAEGQRCRRGYAVAMLPPSGAAVAERLAACLPLGGARLGRARLGIAMLDAAAMRAAEPLVRVARGPFGYLSLAGVKDIVPASSGRPLPLLHVQFGPDAAPAEAAPRNGAVHMLAAPVADPLWAALAALGLGPAAQAAVLHTGLDGADWRQLLTSAI